MTVQRNQLRVYVCSSLVVLLLLLQCPVGILGNWGLEVGRANASDVATLSKDWLRFRKVRDDVVAATLFEGTLERQKQLIGVAIEGLTPQQRYEEVEKFWLDNLIGPLQKIARNPAASCAESQFALATLMGMQRQQQLLGLLEDDKVTASDRVKTELETTEKIVTVRCREEAVDECVATGRIMQILELVLGDDRQSRLRGIEPDDGRWAEEALKKCAIYDLQFVSKTTDSQETPVGDLVIETVRDGKIPIKFDVPEGELKLMILEKRVLLKGKTEGGNNPFFVSVKCQFPPKIGEVVCSPGADSAPIEVRIKALETRHREFRYNEPKRYEHTASEGSKEVISGDDKFTFEFEGGSYTLRALLKVEGHAVEWPMENSVGPFYQAHIKDQIGVGSEILKIEGSQRGTYPTIFQFTYEGQDRNVAVATDSTEFRLIHKPKPHQTSPDPIRKPLKPRPGE